MKTVLICGDRDWNDEVLIAKVLFLIKDRRNTTLIHGDARGVDRIAGSLGKMMKFKVVIPYPADWDTHGNSAGPIRNRKMLKEGKPDLVIAFHNDLARSKGTKDMVSIAQDAGVAVIVVDHKTDISELEVDAKCPK